MIKNNNPEFRIIGLSNNPIEREKKIKDLIKKRDEIFKKLQEERNNKEIER